MRARQFFQLPSDGSGTLPPGLSHLHLYGFGGVSSGLAFPDQDAAALRAFLFNAGGALLMGLTVPAGLTDAESPGTAAAATATAATAALAASTLAASTGAATLASSWASFLHKNCHYYFSLSAFGFRKTSRSPELQALSPDLDCREGYEHLEKLKLMR
jgi:hypothetical protein